MGRLNRTMTGWANYFSLGQVSPAFNAVNRHAVRRLRQWLCRKHKTRHGAVVRYPEERLYEEYGLTRLTRDALAPPPPPPAVCLGMKPVGKPDAGNPQVRLCVQLRLVCSVGDNSTGVTIRSPVAWIAGRGETEFLKPIDKVSRGETASHRDATQVNAQVASKVYSEGRAHNRRAKAVWTAES